MKIKIYIIGGGSVNWMRILMKDIYALHEHSLATLVNVACQFKSEMFLECGTLHINAKSIMGMIAFNPAPGTNVTICADGPDSADAVDAMAKFLMCE